MILVVTAGVSGSGKSTVADLLLRALAPGATEAEGHRSSSSSAAHFIEGDAFHSEAARAKMRAGQPLDDDDRWPWLRALAEEAAKRLTGSNDSTVVMSCSMLKRKYRSVFSDQLKASLSRHAEKECSVDPQFVLLDPPLHILGTRVSARTSSVEETDGQQQHFMPASLLASQLQTFELAEDFTLVFTSSAHSHEEGQTHEHPSEAVSNGAISGGRVMDRAADDRSAIVAGSLNLSETGDAQIPCLMCADASFPSADKVAGAIASQLRKGIVG